MANDFLNKSNGVYTSAEEGADGKPVTPVYLKGNSKDNPIFIQGMQGEQGPKGDKGDAAVIEAASIKNEHLDDGSVNSRTIGKGSVKWDNINSEVQKMITDLQKQVQALQKTE
ncbi:collagen-like protein [Bacillus atrophaeus]|uniref:collagen-like protein n=1 Tax=Bacillus atrophaeus TaxID=1452 RepID=UPI002E1B469B|nr:collagen-like protein [Bacillus atrophaeus]